VVPLRQYASGSIPPFLGVSKPRRTAKVLRIRGFLVTLDIPNPYATNSPTGDLTIDKCQRDARFRREITDRNRKYKDNIGKRI
jgi:hypothetical protein